MKKIVTIIGARPQFVKAAMMSRQLCESYDEIVIHTGQHYDANMSDVFFEELEMKAPQYNLGISGGSHGSMTGRMLISIEEILMKTKPELVIVYGDTNSTLAGALAAVKLGIPVAHIEAGNNRGSLFNPEDINRVTSDHVSSILFACVESAMTNLKNEGLARRSFFVGDSMLDAFMFYASKTNIHSCKDIIDFSGRKIEVPDVYCYMTCHRQENASDIGNLEQIMLAGQEMGMKTIYAVHPRNHDKALEIKQRLNLDNVELIQPVGYLSSVALMSNSTKVVTDSGGLQREAFFAKKQCVTVFDYAWWPETLKGGYNRLAKPDKGDILGKICMPVEEDESYKPFGDGHACEKMKKVIDEFLG